MFKLLFVAALAAVAAQAQFRTPFTAFRTSRPSAPRPQPFFRSQPQPFFRSQPQPSFTRSFPPPPPPPPPPSRFSPAPAQSTSSSSGRSGNSNHQFQGTNYYISWRDSPRKYTWDSARSFCSSRGMKVVSLDSRAKSSHFLGLVGAENQEYFWAGGKVSNDGRTLFWENGRSEEIIPGVSGDWSNTRRSLSGRPQPETTGECLAVLNNVYNDGIRWHDVACHHTKPTICEEV